jgi:hypothetical protein
MLKLLLGLAIRAPQCTTKLRWVRRNGDVTMRPSIDDYYSLLARAASVLKNDTAEARHEVYERARTALKTEFGKFDPPRSDTEALQERLKLDYAIHDFEWSMNATQPAATHPELPRFAMGVRRC